MRNNRHRTTGCLNQRCAFTPDLESDLIASNRELHADLGVEDKAFLAIACATHYMNWEKQHHVLQARLARNGLRTARSRARARGFFVLMHA
jgi:hypothetical protein